MNVKELMMDIEDIKKLKEKYEDLKSRSNKEEDYDKFDALMVKVEEIKGDLYDAYIDLIHDCKNIMSYDGEEEIGEYWVLQKIRQITERVLNGAENKARKDLYVEASDEHYHGIVAERIIELIEQRYVIISEFPWHNGHTYSEVSAIVDGVFEVGEYLSNNSYSYLKDLVINTRCVFERLLSGIKK